MNKKHPYKSKKSKAEIITNPQLIKVIQEYESGKVKPIPVDLEKLKKTMCNAEWSATMRQSVKDEKEGKIKTIKLKNLWN